MYSAKQKKKVPEAASEDQIII